MDTSQKESILFRTVVILLMLTVAAALRIAPHPWNFTPIGAMAIFSGAMIADRRLAVLFPLLALFAGDMFVGFYKLMPVIYASFAVNILIAGWLRKNVTTPRIAGVTLLGAIQFFVTTNFAVWASGMSYPKTWVGLADCYVAGIPYLWNTLAGDALYVTLLFGGFALAERAFPALRQDRGAAML
ncbi:MAG TPA: DUF6580 family putative transport protein [Candidatus Acidoferrum sp.]|jgi:hypothetical protein